MLKRMPTVTLATLVACSLLSPPEFSCNLLGSRASYPAHSQRNIFPHSVGIVPTQVAFSPFSCHLSAPSYAAQHGLCHQDRPPFFSSLQLVLLLLTVGKFDNLAFLIAFLNHLIKPELPIGLGSWASQRLYSLYGKGGEKHKGWEQCHINNCLPHCITIIQTSWGQGWEFDFCTGNNSAPYTTWGLLSLHHPSHKHPLH